MHRPEKDNHLNHRAPKGIERLTRLGRQYGLVLSLHSAVAKTREMLVPAAATTSLNQLRHSLVAWTNAVGRGVTLEYCLIAGVNDSEREADALADFAQGLPCKINLLLYNRVTGLTWKRPDDRAVSAFMARLFQRCPAVTLRKSRGSDVQGVCGQLGASVLSTTTEG